MHFVMSNPHKLGALVVALLLGSLLTACSRAPSTEGPGAWLEAIESPNAADEPIEADSPNAADEPIEADSPTQTEAPAGIPWSQIQAKSTIDDCWIVVLGGVYDFTVVVQQNSRGAQLANVVCGQDITAFLEERSDDINELVAQLEPIYLGPLVND